MKKGFTLIECLVALLIIAIVLASATKAIGVSVDDVHDNYVREAAMWVADNKISQYYLERVYPNLGATTYKADMAGVSFVMSTDVVETGNPYFRRVNIAVSEASKPDYIVYTTATFIAQY